MSKVAEGRKKYIDAAKGWGILMVVFGHITSLGNPVDNWFATYKLAIFFLVSGYLLAMRQSFRKMSTWQYICKQVRALMVPYFGYSLLVMLYSLFIYLVRGIPAADIVRKVLYQLYSTLSLRGISALWFLPCLFIGQVLFILIYRSRLWAKAAAAVVPLIVAHYLPLVLAQWKAVLPSRQYNIVSMPLLAVGKGILAFWLICCGYFGYLFLKRIGSRYIRFAMGIFLSVVNIGISQINTGIDVNSLTLGKYPWLYYVGALLGSFGAILILEFLEKWWKMNFLSFCGRHSMAIMATHGTLGFKSFAIYGWKGIGHLAETVGIRYYFDCTCILAELMLIEYAVICLIQRYLPWLEGSAGKKNVKQEKLL